MLTVHNFKQTAELCLCNGTEMVSASIDIRGLNLKQVPRLTSATTAASSATVRTRASTRTPPRADPQSPRPSTRAQRTVSKAATATATPTSTGPRVPRRSTELGNRPAASTALFAAGTGDGILGAESGPLVCGRVSCVASSWQVLHGAVGFH